MRSYCAGRLIQAKVTSGTATLEEILQDAMDLGDEELAEQAQPYLDQRV